MIESRYEFARRRAAQAATGVAQLDFCETLDMCLRQAMASDDVDTMITESRAVEMLERFEHYCKALATISKIGNSIRELVLR